MGRSWEPWPSCSDPLTSTWHSSALPLKMPRLLKSVSSARDPQGFPEAVPARPDPPPQEFHERFWTGSPYKGWNPEPDLVRNRFRAVPEPLTSCSHSASQEPFRAALFVDAVDRAGRLEFL